jgi:5-methylcytosine-specific restriction endonuclease McrA
VSDYTQVPDGYKKCSKCGAVLPATEEHWEVSWYKVKDGTARTYLKSTCRDCRKAYQAEYYRKNRERKLRYAREHQDKRTEYLRLWKKRNPDRMRVYEQNRGDRSEWWKKYHSTPEYRARERERCHRRRARQSRASGSHTVADVQLIYKQQNGLCWWCGKPVGDDYHIDHRIPLVRGGSNAPENLCISCPSCNMSKGSKMPGEWNGRLL